ncbi:terminase small subunit [Erwinia sp. HR93]|uniref:terminase small subunit n=1 Tax=Erwinia sp. HR93 TaxID=3094840 RepID=UPI002ADEAAAA|nr:terminase small subunit [Erwinia sp. HR93]MEA1064734.1 terminase small subunit [Erwinia sp. HR93]
MSKPDEKAIERDYCAGVLSQQAVADKYGITLKALRYLAGKMGWVRKKGAKKNQKKTGAKTGQKNEGKKKSALKKIAPEIRDDRVSEQEEKKSADNFSDLSLDPQEFGISEQQARFAEYVAMGKNLTEAYRFAGYEGQGATANSIASRLVRNARVSRAIRWLRDRRQKRHAADLDELVHQLMAIATADPNELTQYRRVNCRYCWGENHLYQWRDIAEYDKAAAMATKEGNPEPEYGGLGFVDNALPNPDCPKCSGEGRGQVFIADTGMIDGPARWLFAGVKQTKEGLQVLMHDQDAARRTLLQVLTRTDALRKGDANIPSGFNDFYDDNISTEPEPGIKKLLDDEGEE